MTKLICSILMVVLIAIITLLYVDPWGPHPDTETPADNLETAL